MKKTGFTLIEILMSLAVFSVVLFSLYSVFFMSRKAIVDAEESFIKLYEVRTLMENLRMELESAYFSKDEQYTTFQITDRDYYGRQTSEIIFTTFTSLLPAVSRISYSVEKTGKKLILAKAVISAYQPAKEDKGMEIMEDIESFMLEAKYQGRYVKTWDSSLHNSIPEEVKITIILRLGKSGRLITITDVARPLVGRSVQKYLWSSGS